MIRRTVEISREPAHLATRDEQLLILRKDGVPPRLPANPPNLAGTIPIEDLGILVVDERDTTYSHGMLVKLMEHGGSLVVCGRDHQPCGMLLPVTSHPEVLHRLQAQIAVPRPARKRLWAQIVAAKVRAQAANLPHAPEVRSRLLTLARVVRSGDPENVEAQAARLYWSALLREAPLPRPFRRLPGDRSAPPPNNLLDYGYAVLRAAVARAIVGAGLLPALGLNHAHRANAFCLADDLIEPLRPIVDAKALTLCMVGRWHLDQPTKAEFLLLLTATVQTAGGSGPLQVALPRYVASLARAYEAGTVAGVTLDIPVMGGLVPAPEPDDEEEVEP